uniref:ARID DNA-binding domain-containing protein n=1 Tax=Tanacetum cinerariifolium TaxID=118510 RepID=A0A6L2JL83_TANCI|nr:ARID DNA-binding domain-containing protein [Tanacetum cinerariifolium]
MVNSNSFLEEKWRGRNKHKAHNKQWYQSENHGKAPRKTLQVEFLQRQIRREKENRLGRCVRQITEDCKNMLKKKIKEIEVYNSSISKDKFKQYNCFYCNQKGHVAKACPIKAKDEVSYLQGKTVGYEKGSRDVNNLTQAKINKNKTWSCISNARGKGTLQIDVQQERMWHQQRNQCNPKAPENPMTRKEDMESLEEYQWNLGKKGASSAVEKEKERLEHFGIKLEEEEESKQQQPAYH